MTLFTAADYATLHSLVFRPDYPGYRPSVVESPHGDGKLDTGKRYAHVAAKYLAKMLACHGDYVLRNKLNQSWGHAAEIAQDVFGVPQAFFPSYPAGALRVLEYPPGTGSAEHTDFGLFTVNLWRSEPNPGLGGAPYHMGELGELLGLGQATPHRVVAMPRVQRSLVYFAVPDHAAVLPGGMTVGKWIDERKKRSRYTR